MEEPLEIQDLVEFVSFINKFDMKLRKDKDNEDKNFIYRENMKITYELGENEHTFLQKQAYLKHNGSLNGYEGDDVFELEINGVIFEFEIKE